MASGRVFFTTMLRRANTDGKPLQSGGQRVARVGLQVVGNGGRGAVEPEIGNLRQHLALARDAVGHDAIKGGNAVGGDEQEVFAQIEDFADFAGFEFIESGQVQLQQRLV